MVVDGVFFLLVSRVVLSVGRPPLRLCGGLFRPSLAPRQRALPLGRATRVRESSPPRPSMTVGRPPEVRAAGVWRVGFGWSDEV